MSLEKPASVGWSSDHAKNGCGDDAGLSTDDGEGREAARDIATAIEDLERKRVVGEGDR